MSARAPQPRLATGSGDRLGTHLPTLAKRVGLAARRRDRYDAGHRRSCLSIFRPELGSLVIAMTMTAAAIEGNGRPKTAMRRAARSVPHSTVGGVGPASWRDGFWDMPSSSSSAQTESTRRRGTA